MSFHEQLEELYSPSLLSRFHLLEVFENSQPESGGKPSAPKRPKLKSGLVCWANEKLGDCAQFKVIYSRCVPVTSRKFLNRKVSSTSLLTSQFERRDGQLAQINVTGETIRIKEEIPTEDLLLFGQEISLGDACIK